MPGTGELPPHGLEQRRRILQLLSATAFVPTGLALSARATGDELELFAAKAGYSFVRPAEWVTASNRDITGNGDITLCLLGDFKPDRLDTVLFKVL